MKKDATIPIRMMLCSLQIEGPDGCGEYPTCQKRTQLYFDAWPKEMDERVQLQNQLRHKHDTVAFCQHNKWDCPYSKSVFLKIPNPLLKKDE